MPARTMCLCGWRQTGENGCRKWPPPAVTSDTGQLQGRHHLSARWQHQHMQAAPCCLTRALRQVANNKVVQSYAAPWGHPHKDLRKAAGALTATLLYHVVASMLTGSRAMSSSVTFDPPAPTSTAAADTDTPSAGQAAGAIEACRAAEADAGMSA